MFDDIIGKKEENVWYACHCPICDNVYRREDYDVLYSVMSEHFVQHGEIPKNILILKITALDIPAKRLPEGMSITYTDTVDESLKDLLQTEIINGK